MCGTGDEVELEIEAGRKFIISLVSTGTPDEDGIRQCIFELNGERWFVPVTDNSIESATSKREKARGEGQTGPFPM